MRRAQRRCHTPGNRDEPGHEDANPHRGQRHPQCRCALDVDEGDVRARRRCGRREAPLEGEEHDQAVPGQRCEQQGQHHRDRRGASPSRQFGPASGHRGQGPAGASLAPRHWLVVSRPCLVGSPLRGEVPVKFVHVAAAEGAPMLFGPRTARTAPPAAVSSSVTCALPAVALAVSFLRRANGGRTSAQR